MLKNSMKIRKPYVGQSVENVILKAKIGLKTAKNGLDLGSCGRVYEI